MAGTVPESLELLLRAVAASSVVQSLNFEQVVLLGKFPMLKHLRLSYDLL